MSADLIDFAAIERELYALRRRPGVVAFPILMALSGAERARAYRARQRVGHQVFAIDVDAFGVVDALIEAGRITEAEAEALEPTRVATALSVLVDDWRKSVTRDGMDHVPRAKISSTIRR